MLNTSESLAEKFVKKGFWLYLFSFIAGPVGYFIKIIFSYDLSVSEMGILYGVISLITLLASYHDLGLTESLNFFLPKAIVRKDWNEFKSLVFFTFAAQFLSSLLIGGLLFFGSGWLSAHYFHEPAAKEVLEILCLFFFGLNLHNLNCTIFGVSQNTKLQKGAELLRMIAILVFTVLIWTTGHGTLIMYTWSWIVGVAFGILFGLFSVYREYYVPYLRDAKIVWNTPLIKEVIRYALWVILAANVGTVLGQVDMQLIIYFLGSESAGYYTNYLSLIGIPFLIITPIIGFIFPVVSELHGRGSNEKIKTIKSLFYKYFAVLGIGTGAFLFVFGPEMASVFFGEKFRTSGEIIRYSSLFMVFNFLLQINFQILAGIGRIRERVKILAIGLVFNVILNLALIRTMGVYGSALAVGIAWIPIWYLANRATREFAGKFDFPFLVKNTVIIGLLSIAAYYGSPLFMQMLHFSAGDRVKGLFFIVFAGLFYIIPTALLNWTEFRLFLGEIKTIRNKPQEVIEDTEEQIEKDTMAV